MDPQMLFASKAAGFWRLFAIKAKAGGSMFGESPFVPFLCTHGVEKLFQPAAKLWPVALYGNGLPPVLCWRSSSAIS
jgi:hypothetical protein